jgi:hypothetical protein
MRAPHVDHVALQVDHAGAAVLDITERATAEHCEDPHGPVRRGGDGDV